MIPRHLRGPSRAEKSTGGQQVTHDHDGDSPVQGRQGEPEKIGLEAIMAYFFDWVGTAEKRELARVFIGFSG